MSDKIYVKMEVSSCWGCDKDAERITQAMMSDSDVNQHVEAEITVDKVKSITEIGGQYIYVHVSKEKIEDGCEDKEPLVKFNNGFLGGGDEVLFNNPLIKARQEKGFAEPCEVAVYWTNIKPAIMKLLGYK